VSAVGTEVCNERHDAALDYQRRKFLITLCDGKAPLGINWGAEHKGTEWGKKRWSAAEIARAFAIRPELNVGILFGEHRGDYQCAIDIEADSAEEEAAFAALFSGCEIPVTPTFASKRGKHRLFAWHDGLAGAKTDGAGVVYFRHNGAKLGIRIGNGKQIHSCVPPSVNDDGTPRRWLVSLDDASLGALPDVVVERIVKASKQCADGPKQNGKASTGEAASEQTVAACLDAMRRIEAKDGNDGSRRLFAYACRVVEHDLSDEQGVAAVHNVAAEVPFPKNWSDADILARIRDAEKTTQRGKAKEAESTGGLIAKLGDTICQREHFAQDEGGKLYRFSGGVYKAKGEEFVRRQVKSLLQEWKATQGWSRALGENVVEYVRVDAPLLWERPPLDVINVLNGLLDVAKKELRPHNPAHLSPIQLPVKYDAKATCPAIEKFVGEVFPPDATALAWEIPAYLMTPDTSIQKALLLLGPGGNGKSTWLEMLIAFLGRSNVSALSLHKLESDRFSVARLYGKLANICPDLPTEHLAGTSVFKSITGGDQLTGEHKFKDSFEFTPFCRLGFSANDAPRSQDASQGFFERWLVILFNRSFRGTSAEVSRKVLDARLSAPSELSGLLNKAIAALPQVRTGRFSQCESVTRAWQEFVATTDPLAIWLDRYTVDDSTAVVVKRTLRVAFNAHLESQGKPAITDTAFGLAIVKHRPKLEIKQRTVSGKLQWCYVGIGLLSDPQADSRTSQGSQSSPSLVLSHAREEEVGEGEREEGRQEQDRANLVNPVNLVDSADSSPAACDHLNPARWRVEGNAKVCPGCGKWMGAATAEAF
jgi:putative DNA primase/helicase